MLVLTRKVGERIQIGDQITVSVIRIQNGKVRIGIEAPDDVRICRDELESDIRTCSLSDRSKKCGGCCYNRYHEDFFDLLSKQMLIR